jgi:hypothetical protein
MRVALRKVEEHLQQPKQENNPAVATSKAR